jgi:hypothetical protein
VVDGRLAGAPACHMCAGGRTALDEGAGEASGVVGFDAFDADVPPAA